MLRWKPFWKTRLVIYIYKTHQPDDCVGFTSSCPPTFCNKITPMTKQNISVVRKIWSCWHCKVKLKCIISTQFVVIMSNNCFNTLAASVQALVVLWNQFPIKTLAKYYHLAQGSPTWCPCLGATSPARTK